MRYVSDNVISFSILVKGRADSVRVNFQSNSIGGSSYVTDSEAVIQAMEASPMFGKYYHRAPECVNEVVGEKKKRVKAALSPKVTEVPEVMGWQDAAEYLSDKFGVQPGKLVTPDEILKEASQRNIKFSNLQ